jgi:hypothetical protein
MRRGGTWTGSRCQTLANPLRVSGDDPPHRRVRPLGSRSAARHQHEARVCDDV